MTVNVWPPIVSVPVRADAPGLAATVNESVAGPVPLVLPALSVSQLSLLVALQAHALPVSSATLPGPPADPIDWPDAPREKVQGMSTATTAPVASNESAVSVIGDPPSVNV